MRTRVFASVAALALAVTAGVAGAAERPGTPTRGGGDDPLVNHAGESNGVAAQAPARVSSRLPATQSNMDLVGRVQVSGIQPELVADVAVHKNAAYLSKWSPGSVCPGGFWSIDIKNPKRPREVAFVSSPAGSYLTEGMHALRITTPAFSGDLLVASQETCSETGQGGIALYDVSNPAAPVTLATSIGDTDESAFTDAGVVHDAHSIFAWDAGNKAYAIMVDNYEIDDVDIMDITDPRNPRLIKETGFLDWPEAHDNLALGEQVLHHDNVVRKINGRWYAIIDYWDAGYVVLDVTDPMNPVYVSDSHYPATDPETGLPNPEGNAHQAEWSRCPEPDVARLMGLRESCKTPRWILGADEDFSPERVSLTVNSGPNAGAYGAGEFGFTIPMSTQFPAGVTGPVVFGGSGCPTDENGNGTPDRNEVRNAATVPVGAGEIPIIVFSRGVCFFSEKIESGQLAGYDMVIVGNHHSGSANGILPNAYLCGGQGHEYVKSASAACTGHRAMHLMFDDAPGYTGDFLGDLPPMGTIGQKVSVNVGVFDGWGYLNLIDAQSGEVKDTYAVPESLDPRYKGGFGDLSIHEIATDPTHDVGYVAYYVAGARVVDWTGGQLKEVGKYIHADGNNFWGTQLFLQRSGKGVKRYIAMSDRDYGLYIFRFGTDLKTSLTGPRRGAAGQAVTWKSRVVNDGTIDETRTRYTLRLPRGVQALGASATQGTCRARGRTISCNLGRLVPDSSALVSVALRPTRAGALRATARVSGTNVDYDTGNNAAARSLRATGSRGGVAGTGAGGAGLTGRPR